MRVVVFEIAGVEAGGYDGEMGKQRLGVSGPAPLHRDRDFKPFEKYLALRVVHP
jgi:hypothetical protein